MVLYAITGVRKADSGSKMRRQFCCQSGLFKEGCINANQFA